MFNCTSSGQLGISFLAGIFYLKYIPLLRLDVLSLGRDWTGHSTWLEVESCVVAVIAVKLVV